MDLSAPFDSITIDVDPKEQEDLKALIDEQNKKGDRGD